jgi:ribosomal protein S12 methylthiotransferase
MKDEVNTVFGAGTLSEPYTKYYSFEQLGGSVVLLSGKDGIGGGGGGGGVQPALTDDDYRELMEFTRWARFERMGAFAYSEEDGTYSAEHYTDDVPADVKEQRLSRLMRLQQNISAEIEASKVGSRMEVVIDRREGDYYVGRSEFCSPEVDPEVLIPVSEGRLQTGHFYNVTITGAEEFDLYASVNAKCNI